MTIIAALLATGLMFVLGTRLFRTPWLGLVAAAVFALTPLQFAQSQTDRTPADSLPFAIAWLLCAIRFADTVEPAWLLAAGVILGCGLYVHLAALVMMPLRRTGSMRRMAGECSAKQDTQDTQGRWARVGQAGG